MSSPQRPFSYMKSKLSEFLIHPELCQTKEGLIDFICRDCEFWKEDERDYECGAFKLIKFLLQKGTVTVEEIADAVQE